MCVRERERASHTHLCLVSSEVRKEYQSPWNWSPRWLFAILWELGTELGLWERVASVLNCKGAISLAPSHHCYFKMTALFSGDFYYEIDHDVKITPLAFFSLAPGWPVSISCVFPVVFFLIHRDSICLSARAFRPVTVTVNLPSCCLFFIVSLLLWRHPSCPLSF